VDEPRVTLYSRHGCHLCVDAGMLLDDMLGADAYATVDIEADDDMLVRYGARIPVVAVDGVDRLEAPINGPDLARILAEADLL
jgi:glutaredoxin